MADTIDPHAPHPIKFHTAQGATPKASTAKASQEASSVTIDHLEIHSVSPSKMKSLLEATKQMPEIRDKVVEEANALIKAGFPTEEDLDRLANLLSGSAT